MRVGTKVKSQLRILILLFGLLALPAQAHLLKVFAYVEGDSLHGSSYFSGGGAAAAAKIQLF